MTYEEQERETLEIEKLKLEVKKLLSTDFQQESKKWKAELYRNFLLTIAVTTATVTAYFKFLGA